LFLLDVDGAIVLSLPGISAFDEGTAAVKPIVSFTEMPGINSMPDLILII
jgi:hypothetical protein